METVVGVEGSDEEKFEDSLIDNLIFNASPPKQVEDPVVYKLVRVSYFLCDCMYLCMGDLYDQSNQSHYLGKMVPSYLPLL